MGRKAVNEEKEKVDLHVTLNRSIPAQRKALEVLEQYQQNYGLNKRDSLVFILLSFANNFGSEQLISTATITSHNLDYTPDYVKPPAAVKIDDARMEQSLREPVLKGKQQTDNHNIDKEREIVNQEKVQESHKAEIPIDSEELLNLVTKNYGV